MPRSGWRSSLGAEWLAVAVDTGVEGRRSAVVKEHTARNLRLAEQLGAETQTLVGRNVADVLLDFARSRNVTKIVAGKTAQPRWKQWFVGHGCRSVAGQERRHRRVRCLGRRRRANARSLAGIRNGNSLERVSQGGGRRRDLRDCSAGAHVRQAWPMPTS